MLFVLFILIFGILVFAICFLLIKKSHSTHKRLLSIIVFITAVTLITISALVPAFITFPTPESAYKYSQSGNAKLVVSGQKTDFVVGSKGSTDVYAIIPKSDSGWKLGMGFNTKRIYWKISDGISVHVYQYKNSDEYYITVFNSNGGPLELTDNHGSEFQYLDKNNRTLNKTFYTYYAYINNFNNQYTLTVNGKTITATDFLNASDKKYKTIDSNENYCIYKTSETQVCYEIYNSNGETVLSETTDKPLTINMLNDDIVDISIGMGTGLATHKYYSISKNLFSQEFLYALSNSNELIAYIDVPENHSFESRKVIVQNIFDKSAYYKEFQLDFSDVDTPLINAAFSEDETSLQLTYLSGEEETQTSKTLELD